MALCFQFPFVLRESHMQCLNETNSTSDLKALDVVAHSRTLQLILAFMISILAIFIIVEVIVSVRSLIFLMVVLTRRWHGKSYNAPIHVILQSDIFRVDLAVFLVSQTISVIFALLDYDTSLSKSIAFITGCYFLLYFLQGFRMTSYFGTIMHLVIFTDIVSFAFVFVILLIGFGGTMMIVIHDPANPVEGFETLQSATYSMFLLMTGVGTNDSFNSIQNNEIAKAVLIIFICLTVILLLNMLIAAMSESYSGLAQLRNEIWIRNCSSVMLRFESFSISLKLRMKFGKYLVYERNNNRYVLHVESSDPPNCV